VERVVVVGAVLVGFLLFPIVVAIGCKQQQQ